MSNYGHHFFFHFCCGFDKLNKPVGYVNITLKKQGGFPKILLFLGICSKVMEYNVNSWKTGTRSCFGSCYHSLNSLKFSKHFLESSLFLKKLTIF